jgi:phosphopantothenoylcysteine decarboxylase/phosphopantothenate--cysteine ligase
MFDASTAEYENASAAILAAAVADYRPKETADKKIKKNSDEMTVELVKNPDILATLGKQKKEGQVLVGFALETDNELENARTKLEKKNLDFIVLNSLRDQGAGFQHGTNKIAIVHKSNKIDNFELKSKSDVAKDIVNALAETMGIGI